MFCVLVFSAAFLFGLATSPPGPGPYGLRVGKRHQSSGFGKIATSTAPASLGPKGHRVAYWLRGVWLAWA